MFLRANTRKKDGKVHRYWSVVQSRRTADDRVLQRQVLYLGEINDSQKAAWTRAIEVFAEAGQARQVAIFPDDRPAPELDCEVVQIRLSELSLHRPRQWGTCWLALALWEQLDLDGFWSPPLPPSRQGTRWLNVLKTLLTYRLLDPGSEWRLPRHCYHHSALGELLGEDEGVAQDDTLYRCLDKLLAHKKAFFSYLRSRWQDLFGARFEVLLYDLTSTYFESDPPGYGKRRFGYSRDKRFDCVQVVIALIVTPEGFPLAYEVMAGNSAENTTLPDFLNRIEAQYGKAERIEAHIFVAFIAYCLQVTLKYRLKALAPGLTPRAALEKLAPIQMVDVRVPTTDGRVLILPRYTQPKVDQQLLLSQLKLTLPDQPPPRIQSQHAEVA
jgi:hypothetical protein